MNKKIVLLFAALFFLLATHAFAATPEASQVSKVLTERTNGNDAYYNRMLAPAKSLDVQRSESDRIHSVNGQISHEIEMVVSAFKNASEENKAEAVKEAISGFENQVNNNGGVFITFTNSNPSAANSRAITLIPKTNGFITAASVLNVFSSYKRSPKGSDQFYEYSNPQDLTNSDVRASSGGEASHLLPQAASPMKVGQNYAIKKCRQIMGWRCVTAIFRIDNYLKGADSFGMFFSSMADLSNNPDHAQFSHDSRSVNQVSGSTTVYVVKESAKWIMIYGTEVQLNNGRLQFAGTIQNEFKKDFNRVRERLAIDLKISADQLR